MRIARLFTIGGFLSFRALFGWMNPWMYTLTLLVPSLTQLCFFVYLGRAAGVESDRFFLVGNALVAAAAPGLFAMSAAIADERETHTLALLVVSPANRTALFLGRAAPVLANGIFISLWVFLIGSLIFRITLPASSVAPLALTIAVTASACVGLGLLNAAIGLRWRETAVLSNTLLWILLVFAGVNIPLERLPGWMSTLAQALPVTHGVKAARRLASGDSFGDVITLVAAEALIGVVYAVVGLTAIRLFEHEARRGATLEVA
jgi:ABC-2 type transport system permease protein